MHCFSPYRGTVRKLVLGIDIGTTFSGIAYALLDPGDVPKIQGITRFPGQENAAGDSKIPSILYYRPDGTVHAVGAEATRPGIELEVEDHGLIFVEWFKLHLCPSKLKSDDLGTRRLPQLPPGKDVFDVFADFLGYLYSCSHRYICETHGNGESLWVSVEDRIEFVLSHPNGWEGLQQGKMREAAIKAGLVPNTTTGHGRLHFVTEGEASLNFCIQNGLTSDVLQNDKSVIVVDAGGGTIDISSYRFVTASPVAVEEVASPECIIQGSTQVNVRAEHFLRDSLKTSWQFSQDDEIRAMMDYFDASTKPVFKDDKETSYIKLGSLRHNDPTLNIRRGQLMISGSDMAAFFLPSIEAIINVIMKQCDEASSQPSTVFLVGGFAASPWLYSALKEKLNAIGLTLYRPDSHTNKAVANGAVAFHIEQFVLARVMKVTYGIGCAIAYDSNNHEHYSRRHTRFTRPSGVVDIPNCFSTILIKGTRMRHNVEVSESYRQQSRELRTLNSISTDILAYKGRADIGTALWTDVNPELYTPLCTVHADTSQVAKKPKSGSNGVYYEQCFRIVLICGSTELPAQLSWMENGKEQRGPARIVYDDDLEISH